MTTTHESAPSTTDTGAETSVLGAISPENQADATTEVVDTPRFLVRAAQRVESLAHDFGENMANRRTASEYASEKLDAASEFITDTKDHAVELSKGVHEYGKQRLTAFGRVAARKIVRVATSPARAADRMVEGMDKGMQWVEQRAQTAEARKMERVVKRRTNKSVKLQEKQDIAYAKQAKREIKAEAKQNTRDERNRTKLANETARNQAKAEQVQKNKEARAAQVEKVRSAIAEKAMNARARKAKRQEFYTKTAFKTREKLTKGGRMAAKAGKMAIGGAVAFGAGTAFFVGEGLREGKEVTGEYIDKARTKGAELAGSAQAKAAEVRKDYHVKRGHAAARRAANHLNKTASADESYRVPVVFEDGKES